MKQSNLNILLLLFVTGMLGPSCTEENIDIDLTANSWEVVMIKESGQLSYTNTDNTYILHFTSDTEYNLSLDVNACFGQYVLPHQGDIEIQPMGCTKICCDSEFAEALAQLLPKMTGYYSKGEKLYFEGEGKIVLRIP